MPADHVLAIDQGTTSTRAILFDARGQPVASAQREIGQHYPRPGWVEHDPEEIWQSVLATCRDAIASSGVEVARMHAEARCKNDDVWFFLRQRGLSTRCEQNDDERKQEATFLSHRFSP